MSHARAVRLFKRVALSVIVLSVVLVFARYQGLLLPVRIASGSMAEQFVGPHHVVHCRECGFFFRCGVDSPAPLERATCPNCGYRGNELADATLSKGDRVVIDRWAYLFDEPRRGDVVAIVDPLDNSQLAVKRIVGLPNEVISIDHGEVFINDRLHRKSIDVALRQATLVHDDSFRPNSQSELPQRWASDTEATGWKATASGYEWTPTDVTNRDWLTYRNWRCYAAPHPRTEEAPISDHSAYNQGLSRQLHEVPDVLLSCRLQLDGDGTISFLVNDQRESFEIKLVSESSKVSLYRSDAVIEEKKLRSKFDSPQCDITVGIVDQQLLFAIGNVELIRQEYVPSDSPRQPTSRPFAIAVEGTKCSITNIQVYRDIYYLNPNRGDWAWNAPTPVQSNSFFLLGDNSPLSNDSRHWSPSFISSSNVTGKVTSLTP